MTFVYFEMGQAERVLDGDLDGYMDAFLRWSVGQFQDENEQ